MMPCSSIESAKSSSCFKDNERFCAAIDILSSNELGKRLIERINEYLYKSSKNLIIEESFETRFEPNDGKNLKIFINPGDISPESIVYSEGTGTKLFKIKIKDYHIKHISKTIAMFDEMLFHELLHLKHYLEESLGIANQDIAITETIRPLMIFARIKYSQALCMGYRYIKQEERSLFPELAAESSTVRRSYRSSSAYNWQRKNIWDSFEERRTVCGPDLDNLTENAYRLSKHRPVRYIYQGSDTEFFELQSVLQTCTGGDIGEETADIIVSPDPEYVVSEVRALVFSENGKFLAESIQEE